MSGKPGPPKGSRNHLVHGLYMYREMMNGGNLDRRSGLYHALREKEQELIEALGGDPSPQERAIISDTVTHLLFRGSLERYLLGLKSLVRKGRVHVVVAERTRIGAHIRENLKTLGLKRVARELDIARQYQQQALTERHETVTKPDTK